MNVIERFRIKQLIKLAGKNKEVLNIGDTRNSELTIGLKLASNDVTTIDLKLKADIQHNLEEGLPDVINFNTSVKRFDVVVAGEVFEHIYHLKKLLNEIHYNLSDRGYLVLSVPNVCNLVNRVKMLLGRLPTYCADADKYDEDVGGHIRDFNLTKLKRVLVVAGFRIVSVSSSGVGLRGKILIPHYLVPVSWGTNLLVKAVKGVDE